MSIVAVRPTGRLAAVVADVPGSKSIANRVLLLASLAAGRSVLSNVPDGDDSAAMLECLSLLGAGVATSGSEVEITGLAGRLSSEPVTLPTRLAGTTSRFVTALCALGSGEYVVDGAPPLRARPMGPLHDALAALGAGVTPLGVPGHLPVRIRGVGGQAPEAGRSTRSSSALDPARLDDPSAEAGSPLPVERSERAGLPLAAAASTTTVTVPGDVSSQYISALMMIGPYLPGGLHIRLATPLVSRPYVAITADQMAAFGVGDVAVGEHDIVVGAGRYACHDMRIEADASSASYPLAAAAITGGAVTVDGLGHTSTQGDAAFADVLAKMGCRVTRTATSTTVESTGRLVGIDVDMADISDTVPTLAVVAPFAASPTRITGVGFIRRKESDRIGDLVRELARLGVRAVEEADGLTIHPSAPHGGRVETYHDHRLAMSLALVGLVTDGVEVADAEVVSKSWPGYWQMLRGLVGAAL